MRTFIASLTVAALLAPAALAAPSTDLSGSAMICDRKDDGCPYPALYTESSWMTLRVPLAQLGGSLPSDLALAADNLPVGTTITLKKAERKGSDAVLTVSVQRESKRTAVNANCTITLSSGGQALTRLRMPVVGTAYDNKL